MTKGGLARYREEESARGPGHGTAREETRVPKGTGMDENPLPSHATFYVAHAVANDVLIKLALAIGADLVVSSPDDREQSGSSLLGATLARFIPSADFKPQRIAETLTELGPYDADEAESMAMEIVGDAIEMLRLRLVD